MPEIPSPGVNRHAPIIDVEHAALTPVGRPNTFLSECPVCKVGSLAVRRDRETQVIDEFDNCMTCGQRVRYTDVVTMRQYDWAGARTNRGH